MTNPQVDERQSEPLTTAGFLTSFARGCRVVEEAYSTCNATGTTTTYRARKFNLEGPQEVSLIQRIKFWADGTKLRLDMSPDFDAPEAVVLVRVANLHGQSFLLMNEGQGKYEVLSLHSGRPLYERMLTEIVCDGLIFLPYRLPNSRFTLWEWFEEGKARFTNLRLQTDSSQPEGFERTASCDFVIVPLRPESREFVRFEGVIEVYVDQHMCPRRLRVDHVFKDQVSGQPVRLETDYQYQYDGRIAPGIPRIQSVTARGKSDSAGETSYSKSEIEEFTVSTEIDENVFSLRSFEIQVAPKPPDRTGFLLVSVLLMLLVVVLNRILIARRLRRKVV